MGFGFGKDIKNLLYSIPIGLMTLLPSCNPNEPPTAKLEVNPLTGEVPVEVRMKVNGEDPDGIDDIIQYILYIGNETVKSQTPIDIRRTFSSPGNINIYGQVIDSENESDKTENKTLELILGPYIQQSANLINDVEINYSAELNKISSAELKINKNGTSFLTQNINDNSQTGPDYTKVFKFNPDGLTKGEYEFILKSGTLEKKASLQVPNYNPALNLTGIDANLMEGTEKTIILPAPTDKNPEDLPVRINSATSLDGKTQPTLNGNELKIKAALNNIGDYQIKIAFGSTAGGLEEVILSGNVSEDPRWVINPFVPTNSNGAAFGALTTKAQRDAYVQQKLFEDWADAYHIPPSFPPNPTWDCTEYSLQLMTNFHGFPGITGYSGFDLDSIYYYSKTLKDNGKYGLPIYFVNIFGTFGHNMNAILTGKDITKFEDWNFIEPQRDSINVKPGHLYMEQNCLIEIRAPPIDNEGFQQGIIHILTFKVENGNATLDWINESSMLNLINQR